MIFDTHDNREIYEVTLKVDVQISEGRLVIRYTNEHYYHGASEAVFGVANETFTLKASKITLEFPLDDKINPSLMGTYEYSVGGMVEGTGQVTPLQDLIIFYLTIFSPIGVTILIILVVIFYRRKNRE